MGLPGKPQIGPINRDALKTGLQQITDSIETEYQRIEQDYPTAMPPVASTGLVQPVGVQPGQRLKGVDDDEVITYQNEEIVKELLLLDKHLQQGCKIHGTACDCCEKHPVTLQALAEETYGMTGHPIYAQISDWCKQINPMVSAEASASGDFDQDYAAMAMTCREFRKTLMGSGYVDPGEEQ